jgi:hypothetical protein
MDMQDKPELIYRSILVILFIVLLAILYGYSENGRYAYFHKEKIDIPNVQKGHDKYVIDTRTGIIYGHIFTVSSIPAYDQDCYYREELTTGKFWSNGELIPGKTKRPSSE